MSFSWNAGTPERSKINFLRKINEKVSKCHKTPRKLEKKFYEKKCFSDPVSFCWNAGTPERRQINFLRKINEKVSKYHKTPRKLEKNFYEKKCFSDPVSFSWNTGTPEQSKINCLSALKFYLWKSNYYKLISSKYHLVSNMRWYFGNTEVPWYATRATEQNQLFPVIFQQLKCNSPTLRRKYDQNTPNTKNTL